MDKKIEEIEKIEDTAKEEEPESSMPAQPVHRSISAPSESEVEEPKSSSEDSGDSRKNADDSDKQTESPEDAGRPVTPLRHSEDPVLKEDKDCDICNPRPTTSQAKDSKTGRICDECKSKSSTSTKAESSSGEHRATSVAADIAIPSTSSQGSSSNLSSTNRQTKNETVIIDRKRLIDSLIIAAWEQTSDTTTDQTPTTSDWKDYFELPLLEPRDVPTEHNYAKNVDTNLEEGEKECLSDLPKPKLKGASTSSERLPEEQERDDSSSSEIKIKGKNDARRQVNVPKPKITIVPTYLSREPEKGEVSTSESTHDISVEHTTRTQTSSSSSNLPKPGSIVPIPTSSSQTTQPENREAVQDFSVPLHIDVEEEHDIPTELVLHVSISAVDPNDKDDKDDTDLPVAEQYDTTPTSEEGDSDHTKVPSGPYQLLKSLLSSPSQFKCMNISSTKQATEEAGASEGFNKETENIKEIESSETPSSTRSAESPIASDTFVPLAQDDAKSNTKRIGSYSVPTEMYDITWWSQREPPSKYKTDESTVSSSTSTHDQTMEEAPSTPHYFEEKLKEGIKFSKIPLNSDKGDKPDSSSKKTIGESSAPKHSDKQTEKVKEIDTPGTSSDSYYADSPEQEPIECPIIPEIRDSVSSTTTDEGYDTQSCSKTSNSGSGSVPSRMYDTLWSLLPYSGLDKLPSEFDTDETGAYSSISSQGQATRETSVSPNVQLKEEVPNSSKTDKGSESENNYSKKASEEASTPKTEKIDSPGTSSEGEPIESPIIPIISTSVSPIPLFQKDSAKSSSKGSSSGSGSTPTGMHDTLWSLVPHPSLSKLTSEFETGETSSSPTSQDQTIRETSSSSDVHGEQLKEDAANSSETPVKIDKKVDGPSTKKATEETRGTSPKVKKIDAKKWLSFPYLSRKAYRRPHIPESPRIIEHDTGLPTSSEGGSKSTHVEKVKKIDIDLTSKVFKKPKIPSQSQIKKDDQTELDSSGSSKDENEPEQGPTMKIDSSTSGDDTFDTSSKQETIRTPDTITPSGTDLEDELEYVEEILEPGVAQRYSHRRRVRTPDTIVPPEHDTEEQRLDDFLETESTCEHDSSETSSDISTNTAAGSKTPETSDNTTPTNKSRERTNTSDEKEDGSKRSSASTSQLSENIDTQPDVSRSSSSATEGETFKPPRSHKKLKPKASVRRNITPEFSRFESKSPQSTHSPRKLDKRPVPSDFSDIEAADEPSSEEDSEGTESQRSDLPSPSKQAKRPDSPGPSKTP